jgi:hypothetical protein
MIARSAGARETAAVKGKQLYKGKLIASRKPKSIAIFDTARIMSQLMMINYLAGKVHQVVVQKTAERSELKRRKRPYVLHVRSVGEGQNPIAKRRRRDSPKLNFAIQSEDEEERKSEEEIYAFFRTSSGVSWADMVEEDEEVMEVEERMEVVDKSEMTEKERRRIEMANMIRMAQEEEDRETMGEEHSYRADGHQNTTTTSYDLKENECYGQSYVEFASSTYPDYDQDERDYDENADYFDECSEERDPSVPKVVLHSVDVPEARVVDADLRFLVGHDYFLEWL